MFQVIIGIACYMIFFGYTFLYLWYLSWPVLDATMERVGNGGLAFPGTSSKKRHQVISYSFEYKGKKYYSSRQGLLTAKGFAREYRVNQIFKLKVCPWVISLSCPKRIFFETGVFILISILSLFGGYFYYMEMYGNWWPQ